MLNSKKVPTPSPKVCLYVSHHTPVRQAREEPLLLFAKAETKF